MSNKGQNRIDTMFARLKEEDKKALITFLTAGDPTLETTKEIILDMERNGADLIEIGVPFSDPIAEGPVIQAANERALTHEINVEKIMQMVGEVRRETQVPLVYLMYYNSVYTYGLDRFFSDCKKSGIDAVIIPDLPFEESGEIAPYAEKYGVYHIMLVSPTSQDRMQKICANAKGFLYCVSSLGVTGMRQSFSTNMEEFFAQIYQYCTIPACIGFGVTTKDQATALRQYCDGIIVGSAIVNEIGKANGKEERIRAVRQLVCRLREGLDAPVD